MKEIKVPILPESINEATVAAWHKKPGDYVELDDVIVEIETDKVVLEVPAEESGVLSKISAKEGATVKEQQVLGLIDDEADIPEEEPSESEEASEEATNETSETASQVETETAETDQSTKIEKQPEKAQEEVESFARTYFISSSTIEQPNGRKSTDDSYSQNHCQSTPLCNPE